MDGDDLEMALAYIENELSELTGSRSELVDILAAYGWHKEDALRERIAAAIENIGLTGLAAKDSLVYDMRDLAASVARGKSRVESSWELEQARRAHARKRPTSSS